MLEFIFPGRPVTRPAHVKALSSHETPEAHVLRELRQQYTDAPLGGPVFVEMEFYFEPPATASKKARKAMLAEEVAHVKQPHLDRLLKFYFDAMKGYAWLDDCQVIDFTARKAYTERARTVIKVWKLGGEYEKFMAEPVNF